jgi:adenine-specific DNA glycosylase
MPREPNCTACPLRGECAALHEGGAAKYPVSEAKAPPAQVEMLAAVFVRYGGEGRDNGESRAHPVKGRATRATALAQGGQVLMRRRAVGGLWSGLWEPPCAELDGRSAADAVEELAREESLVVCAKPRRVGVVRHQLTHRSLTFRVYECRVAPTCRDGEKNDTRARRRDRRWCGAEQLESLAISTAHRKVLRLIW